MERKVAVHYKLRTIRKANCVVTKHERYIYRGYLQIAALGLKREAHPALWYVLWDPTEPIATRPLAIQKDGTWYTYGHDLTKNVWELYKADGTIATAYDYAPFGEVTANGTAEQPFQWSSEFYDSELGMVYYNFRFYNPSDGRWILREPIAEQGSFNLYSFTDNLILPTMDVLGLMTDSIRGYIIHEAARGVDLETIALATGMSIVAIQEVIRKTQKKKRAKCTPCDPPAGTRKQRSDYDHEHGGMCPHYHIYQVNQKPAEPISTDSCHCFYNPLKTGPVGENPNHPEIQPGEQPQDGELYFV